MAEQIVIDSGPLIILARIEALPMLGMLPLEFVCPFEVSEELDRGASKGHPKVEAPWLQQVRLSIPVSPIVATALGPGEAAVIQLALQLGIGTVCMDDAKARRAARAVGLEVTGSLGLLIRLRAASLIPAVTPYVRRAEAEGAWYDKELIRRILASVGE